MPTADGRLMTEQAILNAISALSAGEGVMRVSAITAAASLTFDVDAANNRVSAIQGDGANLRVSAIIDSGSVSAKSGDANQLHTSSVQGDAGLLRVSSIGGSLSLSGDAAGNRASAVQAD